MLFAEKLRQLREEKRILQRQLASILEIDTPMYSRIERGERRAKREQIAIIAKFFDVKEEELVKLWLADRVYQIIENENSANDVLNIVSENIVEYEKK